ncbi:hypothetical protein [Brevibacillus dissolubilis]|uniref:hypothetical protein n=1 Tax=Brevibacillus dissolubilis TaxID=1844116 RepID=UPI00111609F3|nr:hypothetical protein [Brevibacillus dissolubilis]
MRSGKGWIKKGIIIALILSIVGIGVKWVAGVDRSPYEQAFTHTKQSVGQFISSQGGEAWAAGPRGHHDRGMRGGGQHHHGIDGGMIVGGIVLAGGLLYWVNKRRKSSGGILVAQATPVIPTTSDFLDQWEKNQTNTKESN